MDKIASYPQLILSTVYPRFVLKSVPILYSSCYQVHLCLCGNVKLIDFSGGSMRISLIVAMDRGGLIGRDNSLPWRLSADLKHFRKTTMGKPIIMGRRTHESIGRPLPGRQNIVITTDPHYQATGCDVVHSPQQALSQVPDAQEVMVMGGASLYREFLPMADRLYITRVEANLTGDTYFPEWSPAAWQCRDSEVHTADENNDYDYCFEVFERV